MLAQSNRRVQGANHGTTPAVPRHEAIDRGERSVHDWRVTQLIRIGIPGPLAEANADRTDWHEIARPVQHGCPPRLAFRIIR